LILGPNNGVQLRNHGAHPSDPWKLARLIPAREHPMIAAALATAMPRESNLLDVWTVRLNQGPTESCTAHSFVAALHLALVKAGAFGTMPLADDGRQPADVVAAAKRLGVHPFEAGLDAVTDVTPQNVCVPMTALELSDARPHTFDFGEHLVVGTDPDAIDTCIATLTAEHPAPLWIAGVVGDAYQALRPGGVAEPETAGGGHAQAIVGHRTVDAGAGSVAEFLVLNSWGADFCEDGCAWVSEAWVRACWEIRPMTATPPGLLARMVAALRLR
jgi:hypothetical protein